MTDVLELTDAMIRVGIRAGFEVTQFGEAFGYPLIGLRREGAPGAPRVYLSGGVHGDEPAGSHAVKAILASDLLPRRFDLTICPLLNPSGLEAGTRENRAGVDLNRDFVAFRSPEAAALRAWLDSCPRFDLSLSLHEDWEAKGFYLYYIEPDGSNARAGDVRDAVAKVGAIERATQIDGWPASDGIVEPPREGVLPTIKDWPEALYLYHRNPHRHFTLETPSGIALEKRIPMHMAAVAAAIRPFSAIAMKPRRR